MLSVTHSVNDISPHKISLLIEIVSILEVGTEEIYEYIVT